ncbi:MAG: glycerol-3-phosphate dehydrogenase [Bacteroidetes bacterium]|nr:glycerol-3-phosphate dehydrogenase [Bacteroidota bacterium]
MLQERNFSISFIGAGAIGTALGDLLSEKINCRVTLHSIEQEVVDSINLNGINNKYFPMNHLHPGLKATTDDHVLSASDIIFLAIPSGILMDYLESLKAFIHPEAILINLAKGFGFQNKTITECLKADFPNPVCSLKGPTFAREIINRLPSAFTLGYYDQKHLDFIHSVFAGTTIYLDYSKDIRGVEILSILKNIYAIIIGIVDAHFNSPNLRSLILTRAFTEMRDILLHMGGEEETMFRYCGIGDFTHTAMNDLSRNRTLGLLIGKGFFTEHVSHELVLEGRSAVTIIYEELKEEILHRNRFPLLAELYKVLNNNYQVTNFISAIL